MQPRRTSPELRRTSPELWENEYLKKNLHKILDTTEEILNSNDHLAAKAREETRKKETRKRRRRESQRSDGQGDLHTDNFDIHPLFHFMFC